VALVVFFFRVFAVVFAGGIEEGLFFALLHVKKSAFLFLVLVPDAFVLIFPGEGLFGQICYLFFESFVLAGHGFFHFFVDQQSLGELKL
jgi:hypothetical protein